MLTQRSSGLSGLFTRERERERDVHKDMYKITQFKDFYLKTKTKHKTKNKKTLDNNITCCGAFIPTHMYIHIKDYKGHEGY